MRLGLASGCLCVFDELWLLFVDDFLIVGIVHQDGRFLCCTLRFFESWSGSFFALSTSFGGYSVHLHPPVTRDVYYAVAFFLQLRTMYPELVQQHRGADSLLLTPRLDTHATFAKLFADIGVEGDVRYAQIDALLEDGPTASNCGHLAACASPAGRLAG